MNEWPFRLALIVCFLLFIPVLLFFRIRSQSTGESLDRRQESRFILFTLRPLGAVTMLGLIAFLVNPAWMTWSSIPLPSWLRWLGVALGMTAGALTVWTFYTLGGNLTDTVVTRKQHTLVTAGPYRFVRHPFYDCVALLVVGNGLATANAFVLVGGLCVLSLLVMRTRIEEEKLIARFGEDYRTYMQRTPRFLPFTRPR